MVNEFDTSNRNLDKEDCDSVNEESIANYSDKQTDDGYDTEHDSDYEQYDDILQRELDKELERQLEEMMAEDYLRIEEDLQRQIDDELQAEFQKQLDRSRDHDDNIQSNSPISITRESQVPSKSYTLAAGGGPFSNHTSHQEEALQIPKKEVSSRAIHEVRCYPNFETKQIIREPWRMVLWMSASTRGRI